MQDQRADRHAQPTDRIEQMKSTNDREREMNIESFEKGIRLPFRRTMITSLLGAGLLTAAAAQAQERAGNPFVGASSYLNPDYTKDVNFSI
jgi:hypothetical protein